MPKCSRFSVTGSALQSCFLCLVFIKKKFVILTIKFCKTVVYQNALNFIYHLPLQLPKYTEFQSELWSVFLMITC